MEMVPAIEENVLLTNKQKALKKRTIDLINSGSFTSELKYS